ncbi:hypothetical protein D3C84_659520 [compost metagenome]
MAILPTWLPGIPASPVRAPSMSPGRSFSLRPPLMHRVAMGGSSGSRFFTTSSSRRCQFSGACCRSSMAWARLASAGATRLRARPFSPARPLRPTRCTCTSGSRDSSTLITASSPAISRPRAATSVATSTLQLWLAKRVSTSSRSRCSSSPCSDSAETPCSRRWASSSWHCWRVWQKATQDCGRTCCKRRSTASMRWRGSIS